ncbi:protein translocase subunit SecD [Actinoplanes sp. KI2]|uniref:protein translocase subunit SecD n=1 Tax=Actinoplanes sp. KI2 TaxID=2983315 RepID=UPI0021D5DBD9|nr:protein translocase subunit SecD [Actinoplanes sp. KI2]MCU7724795.1 protein translocase subunit SecD [Actinoplanes sp. KI2]
MHPGRQLGVLGLVFVVLYLAVFFLGGAKGSFTERLHPKLGLDLVGGTQATYIASVQGGQVPSKESMEQAKGIIENRVNALGVSEAEVVVQGQRNIVVSLAGKSEDQLKDLAKAAQMRFRLVVGATGDVSASALNPPSASPSASASAKPSTSAGAKASASAAAGAAKTPSASATPSASTTPSATPTPTPSETALPQATGDENVTVADVQKKVGPAAWAAAEKLTAPVDLSTNKQAGLPYAAFSKLDGAEVNVLSPQMQFNVPTISCAQLAARPNGAIDDVNKQAAVCYNGGKVLLDKAPVVGEDISKASPQLDQQNGQWVVSLDFKSDGSKKWANLTRQAFTATSSDPCYVAATAMYGSIDHCAVAVVLDKEIVSAPQIQGVLTGTSQITGQFTASSAKQLADQLNFGALPVTFASGPAQTVSATLGIQQLKAGLLAAAIGMLLVAVYAFFYYRLLGTVIFLSLILSALLTFGALDFLGRTIGFTLTLAGIAGFIVSLGVAADSFVIYFERLKDEIREGRSPRSAVSRAWVRARRTIISANTITIMAAVVLYIVSIGAVQGFAFALGLSTVLDLVVVFLFRHPIMTMLASTKAFMSPRVSGLGRVLRRTPTDVKEA